MLLLIYFPNAKICVDSFHVIKQINTSFTKVRVRVMKSFDTSSEEYYLLKHYYWLLDKDSSRIERDKMIKLHKYSQIFNSRYVDLFVLIDKLLSLDYDLCAAYSLKEEYAYINSKSTSENASSRIDNYISEMIYYDIREFRNIAKMLRRWHKEIVNSFDRFYGQRISNGPIESVNSRIQIIKQNGNGYSNFERFRKRVLYSLNKSSSIKNL